MFVKISNLQCTILRWKWVLKSRYCRLFPSCFLDGPWRAPLAPGSRRVCVLVFPGSSCKVRLTSTGAQEAFNMASFWEKENLQQGQGEIKGTYCCNPLPQPSWRRTWQPRQCSCLENAVDRGAWWAAVPRGTGSAQACPHPVLSLLPPWPPVTSSLLSVSVRRLLFRDRHWLVGSFGLHTKVTSHSICLSLYDLFPSPFVLLQMAKSPFLFRAA